MSRTRRIALVVGVAIVAAVAAAVPYLGWTSRHQPWMVATGWNRIPAGERPVSDELWDAAFGERPRLRWLGHAGIRIEWHGSVLVTDPNLNDSCTVAARVLERVEPEWVGRVDAVLVSHAHYDHLDIETLRAIAPVGAIAIPKGARLFLPRSAAGDAKVVELTSGESFEVGALTVTAVPAAHNGNRFHPLASRIGALGYVISDGANAIYVAGDTADRNDFEGIRDRFHPRVAILPVGAFLPKFPVGRYHLSPEQAVAVAKRLAVETVVPYHFGTFRLSFDDPDIALPRFAAEARREKLRWVMPKMLGSPGDDVMMRRKEQGERRKDFGASGAVRAGTRTCARVWSAFARAGVPEARGRTHSRWFPFSLFLSPFSFAREGASRESRA